VSGWIKIDKDLSESLRFKRVVRKLRESSNALRGVTSPVTASTIVLGALARLWMHADTHIENDDVLEATVDEIDELVGVDGFAAALPADWLQVVDSEHIKLTDFLAHNGGSARERKQGAKRQAAYRSRKQSRNVTSSNALRDEPRPDQTRPEETRPDTDQTRAREVAQTAESFARLKAAYPEGTYRQSEWLIAERDIEHHVAEGHGWSEIHAGVERYAQQCQAKGSTGTQFVLSPSKFFARGPQPKFLEPYPLPAARAGPVRKLFRDAPTTEELEAREAASAGQ
jgi:hypothetical protein